MLWRLALDFMLQRFAMSPAGLALDPR